MNSHSKRQILSSVALIIFFIVVIVIIALTRPQANRRPSPPPAPINVAVLKLIPTDFETSINSYGMLAAKTQVNLSSRVNGIISKISKNFRQGSMFEKGELLVELEKEDYEIELAIAKAQIAQAESNLENERALAKEAKFDWERSGRSGEAPALALRIPQLKAAQSNFESAKAAVKRAQLNLERCEIRAPFAGQVLTRNVGVGQVVNVNTSLGSIFSHEAAEIVLPIKNNDYALLAPKLSANPDQTSIPVTLFSQLGDQASWRGVISRISGDIDEQSRQLHVIAEIENAFNPKRNTTTRPLKVNEYLTAKIEGSTVKDALVIPNSAIYQGSYVYLHEDGKVLRQTINIQWSDDEYSIINQGLEPNQELVTTPLGRVNSGTRVKIINQQTLKQSLDSASESSKQSLPSDSLQGISQ